jgi:aryl-phospho-beta-D-glucosidase BglC (GH1 family)
MAGNQSMLSASDFLARPLKGVTISSRVQLVKEDFQHLATSGAKLVRMAITLDRCPGCTRYEISARDFAYARQVVAFGRELGFHVVIALEPLPAGHEAEYWSSAELQKSIADRWQEIAAAFNGEPSVAGFDLINEPLPPEPGAQAQGKVWFEFADRLVSAIRQSAPSHVIFVEVAPWGLPKGFATIPQALPHSNLVYSFHFYEPHQITHQGLRTYRSGVRYPSEGTLGIGGWNKERLSALLGPVRKFARENHVPIYVGEFSCIRWAPGDSAYRYVSDLVALFNAEGWSWTYHQYRGWSGWDAEMDSDGRADVPRSESSPVFQLLKQEFQRQK